MLAAPPSNSSAILPDPRLTPGDTLPFTPADVREVGYSSRIRDVPLEVKHKVYDSYGIRRHQPGDYELDHLIPLSLGGSNSPRNLWPESNYTAPWNALVKDRLEFELLVLVRRGRVDLQTAQDAIAANWIEAYKKDVGANPLPAQQFSEEHQIRGGQADVHAGPRQGPSSATAAAEIPSNGSQVWVNLKSGVIWKPGTEFYGKTKQGRFMSPDDAVRAGYHYPQGAGAN